MFISDSALFKDFVVFIVHHEIANSITLAYKYIIYIFRIIRGIAREIEGYTWHPHCGKINGKKAKNKEE